MLAYVVDWCLIAVINLRRYCTDLALLAGIPSATNLQALTLWYYYCCCCNYLERSKVMKKQLLYFYSLSFYFKVIWLFNCYLQKNWNVHIMYCELDLTTFWLKVHIFPSLFLLLLPGLVDIFRKNTKLIHSHQLLQIWCQNLCENIMKRYYSHIHLNMRNMWTELLKEQKKFHEMYENALKRKVY